MEGVSGGRERGRKQGDEEEWDIGREGGRKETGRRVESWDARMEQNSKKADREVGSRRRGLENRG